MKEFLKRTVTAVLAGALMIMALLWNEWSFAAVFLLVAVTSLFELYRMTRVQLSAAWTIIGSLAYLAMTWMAIQGSPLWVVWVPLGVFVVANLGAMRFKNRFIIGGVLYIMVPLGLVPFLAMSNGSFDPWLVLSILFMIWANDTFAYITGSLLGRTKLAPSISPKKTWEGAVGGFVATLVVSYVLSTFFETFESGQWLAFGLITSIFGNIGDLFESRLKRQFNVKDSGTILPGHGGMLDRFDAFIFVVPLIYAYSVLIN